MYGSLERFIQMIINSNNPPSRKRHRWFESSRMHFFTLKILLTNGIFSVKKSSGLGTILKLSNHRLIFAANQKLQIIHVGPKYQKTAFNYSDFSTNLIVKSLQVEIR